MDTLFVLLLIGVGVVALVMRSNNRKKQQEL
jgi:hypothetical protein